MPLAGVLLAGGVVWALTHTHSGDDKTPPVAASSPLPSVATTPVSSVAPAPARSARDELLAYVYERAHDALPAQDFVRTNTASQPCGPEPSQPGTQDRVAAEVRSAFPAARVVDSVMVIDKYAGLCSLELRARDDTGTVVVVRIVPPADDGEVIAPRVDEGVESADGLVTQFVRVTTRAGWTITTGSSGPTGTQPSEDALVSLAQQPTLSW